MDGIVMQTHQTGIEQQDELLLCAMPLRFSWRLHPGRAGLSAITMKSSISLCAAVQGEIL